MLMNLKTKENQKLTEVKNYLQHIHPKNSNHRRSHLRAIIALDHSRLGLENEFMEKTNQAEFLTFEKST